MNRRRLWAVCVVVLVGMGVLAVGVGYAKDENAAGAKCSEATLHGRYLVAQDGVVSEGKGQGAFPQGPFALAGQEVYDGNGKVDAVFSANFNGKIIRTFRDSGTYTVKADCTGTVSYPDAHMDVFVAPDGSTFTFVLTNPPRVGVVGV